MGIIQCRDCKEELSSEATTCPKCGAPSAIAKRSNNVLAVLCLCMVGFVAYYAYTFYSAHQRDVERTRTYRPSSTN